VHEVASEALRLVGCEREPHDEVAPLDVVQLVHRFQKDLPPYPPGGLKAEREEAARHAFPAGCALPASGAARNARVRVSVALSVTGCLAFLDARKARDEKVEQIDAGFTHRSAPFCGPLCPIIIAVGHHHVLLSSAVMFFSVAP
jgi:hypothetical protein